MLEPHEAGRARSQGWLLADVYDARSKLTRPQILPITFAKPFNNVRVATQWVAERARGGDSLAMKALSIVMKGLKS
jgi:hypothetical protein